MIEHAPWIGRLYDSEGLDGQRVGILGYSAWTPEDHVNFTVESVRKVVTGEWKNVRFFNDIPTYFSMDRVAFYEHVVFFEFVPCSIGGGEERYAIATADQALRGRERLLRIAREQQLEKLVVFSGKAWKSLQTLFKAADAAIEPLGTTKFRYARLPLGGRNIPIVGLRHPQYASKQAMVEACQAAHVLS